MEGLHEEYRMTDFMVAVASIVKNDEGQILMVKEGKEHVRGEWDFPGGIMEESETIEKAVKREIIEETGFETVFQGIVGVYFGKSQRTGQPSIDFLVESKITGEKDKDLDFEEEILDAKFFPPEKIAKLDLRKQNRCRMIEDYLRGKEIDEEAVKYTPEFR